MEYELYLNKTVVRGKKRVRLEKGRAREGPQILQCLSGFAESLVLLQANGKTLEVSEQESDIN